MKKTLLLTSLLLAGCLLNNQGFAEVLKTDSEFVADFYSKWSKEINNKSYDSNITDASTIKVFKVTTLSDLKDICRYGNWLIDGRFVNQKSDNNIFKYIYFKNIDESSLKENYNNLKDFLPLSKELKDHLYNQAIFTLLTTKRFPLKWTTTATKLVLENLSNFGFIKRKVEKDILYDNLIYIYNIDYNNYLELDKYYGETIRSVKGVISSIYEDEKGNCVLRLSSTEK